MTYLGKEVLHDHGLKLELEHKLCYKINHDAQHLEVKRDIVNWAIFITYISRPSLTAKNNPKTTARAKCWKKKTWHLSSAGFNYSETKLLNETKLDFRGGYTEQPHLPVNCVSLCLCWVLNVWLIQQLLDTQKDLKTQSIVRKSLFVQFKVSTLKSWWT